MNICTLVDDIPCPAISRTMDPSFAFVLVYRESTCNKSYHNSFSTLRRGSE